jgi:hypothetical protein
MSTKDIILVNEETFFAFAGDAPHVALAMIYALSKYYEKYKVTEWCMKILTARGYQKSDLKEFDDNFIDFFDQMLKQDDL